jgi:hypothetical protein
VARWEGVLDEKTHMLGAVRKNTVQTEHWGVAPVVQRPTGIHRLSHTANDTIHRNYHASHYSMAEATSNTTSDVCSA